MRAEKPRKPRRDAGGSGVFWVFAAAVVFLVPIGATTAFAALNWKRGAPAAAESAAPSRTVVAMEVGSTAVNMAVFDVYPGDEGEPEVRFLAQQNAKTNLAEGMSKTGEFNPKGVDLTVKAVRDFRSQLEGQGLTIPPENFILVGSGGLMGAVRDRKDLTPKERSRLVLKNRALLRSRLQEEAGAEIDFIEPHEEASFQIYGVMRPRDWDEGLYVDVGGGGTRCGYRDRSGPIRTMAFPGLRAVRDRVAAGEKASAVVDARVRPALRDKLKTDPEFQRREQVYVLGGITWVMVTTQKPTKLASTIRGPSFVKVSAEDVVAFHKKVNEEGYYLDRFVVPANLDDEAKKDMTETVARMKKIFPTREDLVAGAEILLALVEEMELERKTLWFNRMGHLAWLSRYLEEAPGS
jgi:hypothetical protein